MWQSPLGIKSSLLPKFLPWVVLSVFSIYVRKMKFTAYIIFNEGYTIVVKCDKVSYLYYEPLAFFSLHSVHMGMV